MSLRFEFVDSIKSVRRDDWQRLSADAGPFLSHPFLSALEETGAVSEATGWTPQHLVIYQHNKVVGVQPWYRKSHSYGEYVFDFAWANAYHQHGLAYYPKLISAVPFTPITGSRLLLAPELTLDAVLPDLTKVLAQTVQDSGLSSLHWLFCPKVQSTQLTQLGWSERCSVQFIWRNRHYTGFSDFLSHFTARRRKSVRKERQKISQQGVTVTRLTGESIDSTAMQFFSACYQQTYFKRSGHQGYLPPEFFTRIAASMRDNIMLVIASRDGQPLASALYFYDHYELCGRYWGSLEEVDGLHFECCYYQGIEFCIEHQIPTFNPGTQGEHKILRGFEPTLCYSAHLIGNAQFKRAIDDFLQRERAGMLAYQQEAATLLPYKVSTPEEN